MPDKFLTDLQTQIESIHNTRDFEQLVNDLFVRIHGVDYVTSDYHRDGGLDGYIRSSKTLVAKHCFEKLVPLKVSIDNEIFKKARDDLKKAVKLSEKLEIRRWMFITPYLKPTSVYIALKKEVEAAGFQFDWLDSSFITDVLTKNKDILQNHPKLHAPQIEKTLQDIKERLNALTTAAQKPALEKAISVEQPKLLPNVFKTVPKKEKSKDFRRVLEIYNNPPSPKLEMEVKSIIYSSLDQEAVLQGVHLLASWYKYSRETVDDHLSFIDLGIDAAKSLNSLDSEAVLLADKGLLLSTKFVLLDLEGWGQIEMSNTVGFPLITPEKKSQIVEELKVLNTTFNKLFKEAIEKAFSSNNYSAIARIFSRIGDAAGNRAGHFMALGVNDRAVLERGLSKRSFIYAKETVAKYGDEKELAYILYNFANALGFMGEEGEAMSVLEEAIHLAEKNRMNDILRNVERLEKLIKEPKIKLAKQD